MLWRRRLCGSQKLGLATFDASVAGVLSFANDTFPAGDSCGSSHFNANLHSEPKVGAGAPVSKMCA